MLCLFVFLSVGFCSKTYQKSKSYFYFKLLAATKKIDFCAKFKNSSIRLLMQAAPNEINQKEEFLMFHEISSNTITFEHLEYF